ncbi:hypothetical protein BG003_010206 [Podila horticola]|nr:hypothetical protein BG003_010206 [Podila horticola]
MAGIETKRKIDESIALLNSVLAQPSKKQSTGVPISPSSSSSPLSPNSSDPTTRPRKRNFLPPRPAVLDKLSRLSGPSPLRPTLSDSIAASIAASGSLPKGDAGSVASSQPKQEAFRAKWRYMPWSREQFDERLQTFKPSTWFDKPKLVNAVECAKRGWINTSDDRLECCGGCGGVVIVKIDQDLEVEGSKTAEGGQSSIDLGQDLGDDFTPEFDIEVLGPKFHAMLTDNHVKNCPWKTHPCDDSIYKFPVVSQSRACQELAERAKQLQTMADSPLIAQVRHPLTAEQMAHVGHMVPEATDPKLLALAMFGWTVPEKMQVLACQACHTQCSYIPNVNSFLDDDDDDILMEGDDGQGHGQKDFGFDAVHSHKWYCYWVDPEHNLPKKEEGWKALVQLLMPKDRKDPKSSGSAAGSTEGANSGTRLEPLDAVAQIKRILRGQATLSSSSLAQ